MDSRCLDAPWMIPGSKKNPWELNPWDMDLGLDLRLDLGLDLGLDRGGSELRPPAAGEGGRTQSSTPSEWECWNVRRRA